MPETLSGPEFDLLVIRTVRDRILAGDWTQHFTGRDERNHRCLVAHIHDLGEYYQHEGAIRATRQAAIAQEESWHLSVWNDTHTQAEVVLLLDDVEDSLLGEMGGVG